jgi:hypothetical protein
MLRIRGGKRYFQASVLIGDVTLNKACFSEDGWHMALMIPNASSILP